MPDNSYIEDLNNNNNKSEKNKFPFEIKRVDPDTNKEMLDLFSGSNMCNSDCVKGSYNSNQNSQIRKRMFPYEIKRVDPKTNKELLVNLFSGEKSYFVQVGPEKYTFGSGYEKFAETYYNFEVRHDDVWTVSYPRTGTTWTQEMVWILENNFDYDTASKVEINYRFPLLENNIVIHPMVQAELIAKQTSNTNIRIIEDLGRPVSQALENTTGKRFIKSHLPFSLLPPNLLTSGCKVIYVARNPKDVLVSNYHLNKYLNYLGYQGDLPKFVDFFTKGLLNWAPYPCHLKEAWELKHSENMLLLFYEEMKKDLPQAIKKVSNFIKKDVSDTQLSKLKDHLQFESFKTNSSINLNHLAETGLTNSVEGFIRKGQVSSWKEELTGDLFQKVDEWIENNLKDTGISFDGF